MKISGWLAFDRLRPGGQCYIPEPFFVCSPRFRDDWGGHEKKAGEEQAGKIFLYLSLIHI